MQILLGELRLGQVRVSLKAHRAQWLVFLINLAGPRTTGGISDAHLRVHVVDWGPPSKAAPIFISSAVPTVCSSSHDWALGTVNIPSEKGGMGGPSNSHLSF